MRSSRGEFSRRLASALTVVALLVVPGASAAQQPAGAPEGAAPLEVQAEPAPRAPTGLRAFAAFDLNRMAAAESFGAVVGSRDLTGFGAGAEVLRLWSGLFARVGVSRIRADGNRVVVFGDESVSVGVATTVRMTPLELAGGWRFGGRRRVVPYGGAGLVRLTYEETTDFDQPNEDTSETFLGSLLFGGLDVQVAGPLGFGAEVQHRRLANALGTAGASAAFGENDLGGLTIRVWIGIGR
jgi:hypothetical protein